MKYKNSKFLLIGLLVLSIIISVGAINATNDTSTNTIKDAKKDLLTINIQKTKNIQNNTQQQKYIKSTNLENKNHQKEKTKTINLKENTTKEIKKSSTYDVNNYQELYDKIDEIKTSTDNTTINLNPGNYTITNPITWGSTDQQAKTLTINGNGQTIDGENTKQFIAILNGYTLNIQNIIIKQIFTNTLGSAIYNNGNASIVNATFIKNTATEFALIENDGGLINIINSTFDENNIEEKNYDSYYYDVSIIKNKDGIININNSNFRKNDGRNYTLIYNENTGITNILNSNFTENIMMFYGLIKSYGNISIVNSNFTENNNVRIIDSDYEGNTTIVNSTFNKNNGLYMINNYFNNLTIINSTLSENNESSLIINNAGSVNIIDSLFNKNNASSESEGLIMNYKGGITNVINSIFTENHANVGGAIYNHYGGITTITNSTFNKNNAQQGGVINNNLHADISIINSTFNENNAQQGGVINNDIFTYTGNPTGTVNITNSNFTQNNAQQGGVINNNGNISIINSNFNKNNAQQGGVIYNKVYQFPNEDIYYQDYDNITGNISIINSNFTQNNANITGVIYNTGNINITNANFIKNEGNELIFNNGNTSITDSNFTQHNESCKGIISNSGNTTIINSNFSQNNESGEIIYNNGNINVTDSKFTENKASRSGLIYNNNGNISIINSNFTQNNETGEGILFNYFNAIIINSNFNENYGNIIFNDGNINITNANFNKTQGKVVGYNNGNINFTNSNLTQNNITSGGIITNLGNITFANSTINKNYAGGRIIYNDANISIINSSLIQNQADNGNLILNGYNSNINITNSSLIENNAKKLGIISNSGNIIITNSTLNKNHGNEGIINNINNGNLSILNSNFTQNNANTKGIIYTTSNLVMNYLILTDNFDSNNTVIYSMKNFTLSNSIIINNMGKIKAKTKNTFTSPIVNEELSSDENIKFNIENKTYTTQKDTENYVKTIQSVNNSGELDITIEYPCYSENNTIKLTYYVLKDIQDMTLPSQTIPVFTKTTTIETIVNDMDGNIIKGEIPATLTINDKTYNTTIKNGKLNIIIPVDTLKPGEYIITINIPETINYNSATITQNLIITKQNIQQTLTDKTIPVFTDTEINTIINDTDNTQLKDEIGATITINGNEIPVTIVDGVLSTTLPTSTMNAGEYIITINIPETINYNSATITQKIVITKQNIQQTLPDKTIPVFTYTEVSETIMDINNSPLKGEIPATLTINGNERLVTIENGILRTILPTNTLNAGEYIITINIPETTNYSSATITKKLTINKRDIQQINSTYYLTNVFSDIKIITTLVDKNNSQLKGEISATITINEEFPIIIVNGAIKTILPTSTLDAGEYEIVISIPESTNYNSAVITEKLTISKKNIQYTNLPDKIIPVFTDTELKTIVIDKEEMLTKGEISATITMNGEEIPITIINGIIKTTLPTSTLDAGEYTITINIPETTNYSSATITQKIIIKKQNIQQTLPEKTIPVFTDDEVSEIIMDINNTKVKGVMNVKVTLDNKTYDATIVDGVLSTTLPTSTLDAGEYEIVISIPETTNYNTATITQNLVIEKREIPTIKLPSNTINVFTDTEIDTIIVDVNNIQLKGEISVKIIISNRIYDTTITDGIIKTTLPTSTLDTGEYKIIISIPESTNYKDAIITQNLVITKQQIPDVTLPNNTVVVFTNTEINTTIVDVNNIQLKGKIPAIITINEEEIPVTIVDGVLSTILPTKTLNAGEYTITINIPESTNYNSTTITQNLIIIKQNIQQITLPDKIIQVFTDTEISETIIDTNNNQIKGEIPAIITINEEEIPATIKEGVLNITLATKTLNAGKYTITINIPETTNYNAITITQELTITKREIPTTILPEKIIPVFTNTKINTTIVDINNNPIKGEILATITINEEEILVTIKEGVLSTTIPTKTLNAGEYTVTVNIPESTNYNSATVTQNLIIIKRNIQQILVDKTIPVFTDAEVNEIIFDANNTQLKGEIPVTITLNKQTYNATIKDGKLNTIIPTETLNTGEYTITINILETTNYNAAQLTQKLILTKRDIQQTPIPDNTVIVFTDTQIDTVVIDVNNTQLKGNINIEVEVDGQTYNTTMKDGIIKIKLPTSMLNAEEYLVTIKIPESTNYNSATITQNLVIEKREISTTTLPEKTIDTFTDTEMEIILVDMNNTAIKGNLTTTLTINEKNIPITIINGVLKTKIPTSIMNAGEYTLTINIPENTNYKSTIITQKIIINKRNIQNITLPNTTIPVFTDKTINTIITDMNNSQLKGEINATIIINNKEIPVIIKEGVLNITLPTSTLKSGKYPLTINIPENTNYNAVSLLQTITVNKKDIQNITLPDSNILTLTNNTIFLIINDTQGNPIKGNMKVSVKINGKTQLKTRTNNEILNITLPTDKFRNSKYNLTIIIGNNNYYNQGIITQTINMQKRDTNVSIQVNTPETLKNIEVNVTVTENNITLNDGFLIFKINGKTLKDTNGEQIRENVINGKAQLKYMIPQTIGAGKYNISVYYINPYYNKQMCIENFTIIRSNINNKTLDEIQVIKGTNTTITIIANDTNGNQIQGRTPICIKFNGKAFIHANITNGIINVILPTDTFKNTYNMTIVLGVNSLYNKAIYNGTIKIVQPQRIHENKNEIDNMTITP